MTTTDALKEIIQGHTQTEAARKMGITKAALNDHLNRRTISLKRLQLLAERMGYKVEATITVTKVK